MKRKFISVIFFICLSCTQLFAVSVPSLSGRVVDNAGIMKSSDREQAEQYLKALEDTTGIQIAVLTMPNIGGEDIASFSIKVAESWKLGQKDKDNGALLVVALEEHDVRIEVGYGLEGLLTDTKCGLIIRNVIIPEFKNGNYSAGILKGVKNMGGVASENAELVSKSVMEESTGDDSIIAIVFMIIWLIFFISIVTSRGGIFKWLFLSRLFGSSSHRTTHRTTFTPTNFSSHSSGFSGGSFGGFSGGGGHFGGGGASGHW